VQNTRYFSRYLFHQLSLVLFVICLFSAGNVNARTQKPVLHGKNWVAITGKPLAATSGAIIFQQGGNAVDAAVAMLATTSTMWDVLSWGGETQALIYNPNQKKVIGINALGVAPTAATAEFFREKGYQYPPDLGPLAAVTPGTPGGLMTMLAEWGRLSLAEVLAPAIQLADGYPIEEDTAKRINKSASDIKKWPASASVFFTHPQDNESPGPRAGEIFRQPDLAITLRKLVQSEASALTAGKNRKEAIYAAYDRFYRGDIATELVRSVQQMGGLITLKDLDKWQVHIEEPVLTNYKGIDVYKLTSWTQGPVLLQTLNILENVDLKSMGYNSSRYIHTLYQAMNLAFADRDFYYGDPYFPPAEPMKGLLSKKYAKHRLKDINWDKNDPLPDPGDPYQFQKGKNPYPKYLKEWNKKKNVGEGHTVMLDETAIEEAFLAGTTSIQTADAEGWVVSVTPSGGWVPAVVAGKTGIGLSQRMQSFVLDPAENPYNVVEPGKRPRVTLTPSIAMKEDKPFLAFSVQGGDTQDQNLLQFLLNMVEWEMNPQEAAEAANITSFQMRGSFQNHPSEPGKLWLRNDVPKWVRSDLTNMGYKLEFKERTSGPITAIWFDWEHGSMWGAASNFGDDYGIAW
jgi:gamma-glutamyltranspeptidase / glutathione hydrolase